MKKSRELSGSSRKNDRDRGRGRGELKKKIKFQEKNNFFKVYVSKIYQTVCIQEKAISRRQNAEIKD